MSKTEKKNMFRRQIATSTTAFTKSNFQLTKVQIRLKRLACAKSGASANAVAVASTLPLTHMLHLAFKVKQPCVSLSKVSAEVNLLQSVLLETFEHLCTT